MPSITDVINDREFMKNLDAVCANREKTVLHLIDKVKVQLAQAYETIEEIEKLSPYLTHDSYSSASGYLENALRLLKRGRENFKFINRKRLVTAAVKEYFSRKLEEHNASSS